MALELDADIRTFLDYLAVECGLSPNTVSAYGSDLAKFSEFVRTSGVRKLEAISSADIVNFLGG